MSCSVLVVGAGPVGLVMAGELARYGVGVRVVDKGMGRTDKSKALVLWSRSLELIDRMGCGEGFVSAGLKVVAANIMAGEKRLGQVRLDVVQSPHPYALMLPQSETERLLEEHLNGLGVRVERGVEMAGFEQDMEKVTASLRYWDGREERVECLWMIGCDGAHSTVRHGLGMAFEGRALASDWILADVCLEGGGLKGDELDIFWHSEGALALFPISPGRYRVVGDVVEPGGEVTLEEVQGLLDRRGPGGVMASGASWLSRFRINERMVAEYRKGRVFLAGDAAHVHSPAGGQGMNTGMQDAFNLGWKLAMVARGRGKEEPLLGSYSVERSEVGRRVLRDSDRLTKLAVIKGGAMQAVRNHLAGMLFGLSLVRRTMANKLAEISIGYSEGPLTRGSGHGHAGPGAGERGPVGGVAGVVGAGDRPRFAVFARGDEEGKALLSRWSGVVEGEFRGGLYDDGIWVVRPDGYVGMVGRRKGWGEVEGYLEGVVGREDRI